MKLYQQIYPRFRRLIEPKEKELDDIGERIFFLHIPKCGGSSLSRAIYNSYGNRSQQEQVCFSLNGSSARKCSQIWREDNQEYRKKILAYVMSIEKYRYIHGHFAYSDRIFQEFGDKWHFITVLRQPVSQWFSQYFYDTRENSEVKINEDLKTFVDSERAVLMGNTYVRKLTEGIPASQASSPKAIEQAIENLNKFTLVGVLEKMDILIENYNSLFQVPLKIERINKSPVSKDRQQQQITEEIVNKVTELCKPNWEIYQAALDKS